VKKGEMVAVVTATGGNTFFGRTAKLVQSASAQSHFQRAVMRIGDFVIIIAVGFAAVLMAVRLYRHVDLVRLAEFALILLVASVPVAMPAVLSVTMALGTKLLAKKKVIVTSQLPGLRQHIGLASQHWIKADQHALDKAILEAHFLLNCDLHENSSPTFDGNRKGNEHE
jgi:H+-transporting ATPase